MSKKASAIKTIGFFYYSDNKRAVAWCKKIKAFFKKEFPSIRVVTRNPQALIVLGGDGTILEAARKYQRQGTIILGLNLGHVGFLASVREPAKFLPNLKKLLIGKSHIIKRLMIRTDILRNKKLVFSANSLNDVAIQSLLGIVEIEVNIDNHPVQYIRGSGVLVSTATGSTAYNLSAHGPIVMPDIKCMIVTEIMDHNVPTPSIVVKRDREITLKIMDFRKSGLLKLTKTGEHTDVVAITDGENLFSLKKGDIVKVKRSAKLIKFAGLEKAYFFKSLQEKFAFK